MPKLVSFEGKTYSFPDNSTAEEIGEALASMSKASATQSAVRAADQLASKRVEHEKDLKSKGVSFGERKMAYKIIMSPQEKIADEAYDRSLANITELEKEIEAQKDPKAKALLVAEHNRIKATLPKYSTILGMK